MKVCIILVAFALLGYREAAALSIRREATGSCNTCLQSSVAMLDSTLSDTTMDAMGIFMEEQVCPKLKGGDKCRAMSTLLLPVFFRWFKASASPARLCSAPRVCGQGLMLQGTQGSTSPLALSRPLLRQPSNGPLCALCAFVINEMKGALNSTSVQQSIMEKATEVCNTLPMDLGSSCLDFVNTYEPLVTQFIESVDAGELCMLIGACMDGLVASKVPPALPQGLVAALAQVHTQLSTATPSNDACDVCKMAVIEAHSLVVNPTVQADLLNYTKALCAMMGAPLTATCDEYVDTYAPAVFDLMDKFLAGDKLCAQLGICKVPTLVMVEEQRKNTATKYGRFARGNVA